MNDARPRGLGRGLSALLGEPVKADFGAPKQAAANAPAWVPPQEAPAPSPQAIVSEPPRNVFELPVVNAQAQQPPQAPPAAAPAPQVETHAGSDVGPRAVPIDLGAAQSVATA